MTTKVFVHGVPETAAIWEPLLGMLGGLDVVTLSPPGFGAPLPDGFRATLDGYRDWLIAELSSFPEPVDLVGHDFGGGHAMNVVINRPDLIRSWVIDIAGALEPDYVWHDQARVWQTPDHGERRVARLVGGTADERAATMVRWGIPQPAASLVAAGQNEEMGRAILSLYRDAAQPALAALGRDLHLAAARPGLTVVATEDHAVGSLAQRLRAAERARARVVTFEGLGHWWMLQDPALGARTLTDFWGSLPQK